ncbi:MAG: nitroreductase family protein [Bacteroidota bacterium]
MKFEKSVIELIKIRRSVRSYDKQELGTEQIAAIEAILQSNVVGPFGNTVRFELIIKMDAKANNKVKLGTYGFISGARYFIAGAVKPSPKANLDYGYLLEHIILHLTAMNLGTCWLGGTFSRSEYAILLNRDNNIIIPSITPVGKAAKAMSQREKIIRWGAKADTRKLWEELFFNKSLVHSLTKDDAGAYTDPLEMIRFAPSASNKQPWRIFFTTDAFHFYLKRTPGYGMVAKDVDLQMIDIGIAMSHFELVCSELNLRGQWQEINPGIEARDMEYNVSWVVK